MRGEYSRREWLPHCRTYREQHQRIKWQALANTHTQADISMFCLCRSHMDPKLLHNKHTSFSLSLVPHTQSNHTLLAGCVGHICAPAHGKHDDSNYVSDFIPHTCTLWSTSISVPTGKQLFNLAELPRWTDKHTYTWSKVMTQQYPGVDVKPTLFSQIIAKNLINKLSYLMGIVMQ